MTKIFSMGERVSQQQGYILHRRPYRNTSMLLDCFTLDFGRVTLLARGIMRNKDQSPWTQPFTPVLLSWGASELPILISIEPHGQPALLQGEALFCGFYLNELLMKWIRVPWVQHGGAFRRYQEALLSLQMKEKRDPALRAFECQLLLELGALNFSTDSVGNPLKNDGFYRFELEEGLVLSGSEDPHALHGAAWLQVAAEQWDDPVCVAAAKKGLRHVWGQLHSRRLFY